MEDIDKKELSERDICTKFITPAIKQANWKDRQIREEAKLTNGRIVVKGSTASRGQPKRAKLKHSAQPCLYLNKIQYLVIPLPPLAEQKRIVEKVEQLMGLCDKLEAKLRKEREESQKLVEAVVKGLLEGAVAGKSESDKLTLVQAAVIQSK